MLGNQNRSHVSSFIRQQHDARKKIRRCLEEKLDAFLSIGNHAKPPKERTRLSLRCSEYRKESQVTKAWYKSLYGVKIKSKIRQQYSHKNPQKNKIKSEKAYPLCFAVFSRILRRFERCISQQLVHVHHCIMLMKGWKLEVEFECNLTRHLRRALRKPRYDLLET